jgi:hypothetical protein
MAISTKEDDKRRIIVEGIGFGVMGGVIFGVLQMTGAALMKSSPLLPLHMSASVALGKAALDDAYSLSTILIAGAMVHVVLSAMFGALYGGLMTQRSRSASTSFLHESALGMLYGLMIWAFNFYLVAAAFFPWCSTSSPLYQAFMHAAFFGLPLGLMFAASLKYRRARAPQPHPP